MKALRYFFGVLVFSITMVLSARVMAQPGDPCIDPDAPGCCETIDYCATDPSSPCCPVDGGVVALLAAGVGYGIKRARDSRKKKSIEE